MNHSTFFFKLQTHTFFKSFKILLCIPLITYSISPFIKADTDNETSENTNNNNNEISTISSSENNAEESAFNPETGEINWQDYGLSMSWRNIVAHGPCGEDFKDAFSCFVYSKEEPKGMECIKKFQAMQECFKKYPEIYNNEEINNEDDTKIIESNDTQESIKSSNT
ncbi:hypothetical protein MERGE_002842 [Pneumocystis wakefieldiae]|uniref:Mitochondrial intermembrane space import and assembly protein 40 n=1 Tax=Pneumocystis wakefieldiae TaxID=38082 RepID=A0A899G237_9ASCO|nr:hypothetical protein MERGE_002842 [Pneumocystis wakefieldiae]